MNIMAYKSWLQKNWMYVVGGVVVAVVAAYYFIPTVKTMINGLLKIK